LFIPIVKYFFHFYNNKKINQCDHILSTKQQYSNVEFMTGTMFTLDQNVNKHFRNLLFK